MAGGLWKSVVSDGFVRALDKRGSKTGLASSSDACFGKGSTVSLSEQLYVNHLTLYGRL